jgi:hypothetical protein
VKSIFSRLVSCSVVSSTSGVTQAPSLTRRSPTRARNGARISVFASVTRSKSICASSAESSERA